MSVLFNFWAQALDNISADSISVDGNSLAPNEQMQRQQAVSFVSDTALAGRQVFNQSGVALTLTKCSFVLELVPLQTDTAGRAAPIVCFGDIPSNMADWEPVFMSEMERFLVSVEREIGIEQREKIELALQLIKKKHAFSRDKIGIIFLIACICATLGMIAARYQQG